MLLDRLINSRDWPYCRLVRYDEKNFMLARLLGVSAVLSVLLSGSVALALAAGTVEVPTLDASGGVLNTENGSFVFSPTVCAMWIEDGEHDIEVYGPGNDQDGRSIFFEFSSTARAISVGFDVDSAFQSPEQKLVASDVDVDVSGAVITASDFILQDQNGTTVGPGSLAIDCSPD